MSTPEPHYEKPQAGPPVPAAPRKPVSAFAVLSVILGAIALLAVVLNLGGVTAQVIGIILAIGAIASGVVGATEAIISATKRGTGWAISGIVLGLIALILGILAAIFGIIVFSVNLFR
jgi:hypothetical protein